MESEPLPVDLEPQAVLQRLACPCQVLGQARVARLRDDSGILDFLKSRDLGHVDEVSEPDLVTLDPDRRVVADAEVPEWMGLGRKRHERGKRDQDH